MKALVKFDREPGNMELRTVPDPDPGPDEVVVAVRACGVDRGGDLYVWKSTPGMPFAVPVIPGAENCGEIVAVGSAVTDRKVGERVVSEVIVDSCGRCAHCHAGFTNHCAEKVDLGRMIDGAYAEFFKVKASHVHRIPDGVSWKAAVLCEMAAVVAHNLVETIAIEPGDDFAVVGPGPIGLIAVQLAAAAGADRILAVGLERDAPRLALARELGATHTLASDAADYEAAVAEEFGEGFNVVAEGSGHPSGVATAIDLARPRGTLAAIGTPVGSSVSLDWVQIPLKSLRVQGTYAHLWSTWELVLRLMASGALKTERLTTREEPLENWQQAFEDAETDPEVVKIAVTPNGEPL
jgi:2-desacetyl-2-hydroxyethyl bacteriochlorophyllide A dehydrogenase